ncbi:MAG: PKD domain-containing protein [Flavobacteriales bacterium]|jgi:gliding motility-associated-like protein|nr:PKD domain-containing protein [Flavobacteriales bacterium]
MRPVLIALFLACSLHGFATHILGGEMSYTYLGNDNYQVTLRLYRDCGPANTNNTALDPQAAIGIFNSNGVLVNTVHFNLPSESTMPVVVTNPCLTAPPSICTKQGIYTGTIHLPSGTGGYTLAYQRCCRSPAVININNNPNPQGMTCTVQVPDPAVTGPNSSPNFADDPPMVLCLDQTATIDQLAVDPDGDSLAYAMCAPLQGGDNVSNIMPDPPSAPPYSPVIWAAGYSVNNQLNSNPPVVFGTNNGQLTLHPSTIGNFAVSLCVTEYRNGVQLSQVIRDFRFLVVNCTQAITSSFQDQQGNCDGLEVQMSNQSTGSNFYHWDFGVPGTASDTSAEIHPSFTYPAPGTYTISLIANPGWPCADTSYSTYNVHDPVEVAFIPPPTLCTDQLPVAMTALGNFTASASVQWDFGTGVSPDPNSASTTASWSTLGSHAVSVFVDDGGCTASFADSIRIFPLPEPVFSADTNGCIPFAPVFTNSSTAWTPLSFLWQFGDGGISTDSIPDHVYEAPGTYDVSLTVATDSGCIASRTLTLPGLVSVWPQPVAMATAIPMVTTVLDPEVTFRDYSLDAEKWDFLVEGIHYDTTAFTHTFSDAGWYTAFLTVSSGVGCTDTTSLRIFIGDHLFFAPTAFTPNGDGVNEEWKPSVKGAREYQLDIFNRWGEVVFSTNDPTKGWDGKGAAPGVYSFKAWLTEYGPLEREYNGSFVLIE